MRRRSLVFFMIAAAPIGIPAAAGAARSLPVPASIAQLGATTMVVTDPAAALTPSDRSVLESIARETWNFFATQDVDPVTHLPRNNVPIGGPQSEGDYTSPTEIGLYLSSIVAARDLGVISSTTATSLASEELSEIDGLAKYDGFLLRWYSTTTGAATATPKGGSVTNDRFVSSVDDSWFAQGAVVAAQAFPTLRSGFDALLSAMNFTLLYNKSKNRLLDSYKSPGGPSQATYNLLYGGPRIADYMAIGSHTVPGDLWWGISRTPPTKGQRQTPAGQTVSYTDPQNHHHYRVFEGHYTYDGVSFVPTFGGSMFEALAPDLVVPEQSQSPGSLGLNDRNTVLVQMAYADSIGDPIWGFAPASVPGSITGYRQYGAPVLSTQAGFINHAAVTPYASFLALPVLPTQAMANIEQMLSSYPGINTPDGLLDSVNPKTGELASRYMAVSQGVILMGLDNALNNDKLQSYFAASTDGHVLSSYLKAERFSVK
jgi:hypothetical protein